MMRVGVQARDWQGSEVYVSRSLQEGKLRSIVILLRGSTLDPSPLDRRLELDNSETKEVVLLGGNTKRHVWGQPST